MFCVFTLVLCEVSAQYPTGLFSVVIIIIIIIVISYKFGIATRYGMDVLGIESHCEERFSAPVQTGSEAYTSSCTMGTRSLPRG
jgi:hypothetical protein